MTTRGQRRSRPDLGHGGAAGAEAPASGRVVVPFNDLRPRSGMRAALLEASERVISSGWYVLGGEVARFERSLADYLGVESVIGVASGTDAIALALRALGVGPGHEVIVPDVTAFPSVVGIAMSGATPVVVDVDPRTGLIDTRAVERAIGERTRAVLAVHLYGQAADVPALRALTTAHGLALVEDCAQALGTKVAAKHVGTFGDAAAFSFYPTKNLGALGDGGAVATGSREVRSRLLQLRNYGQGDRYRHESLGLNSRLDEIQAAFLSAKISRLDSLLDERRRLARRYEAGLDRTVAEPLPRDGSADTYHLFAVRSAQRDRLQRWLEAGGVETLVHYPVPCRHQPAFASWWAPRYEGTWSSDEFCQTVLSLPLWAGLAPDLVDYVIRRVGASA